jgi:hypothetical protein
MSETSDFAIMEAMKEITTRSKSVLPAIAESIFVKKYLPMFASKEPVDISKWLEIAGTATTPVMVLTDGGEFLFEVPALLQDIKFREAKSGADSVTEIVADASNKARVNPQFGMNYLNIRLQERIVNKGIDLSTIIAWNRIFARYGYEPVKIPEELLPEETEVKVSDGGDGPVKFDEFEEL